MLRMFNGVLVDPVPAPAHTISPLDRHLYWVSTYVEVAGTVEVEEVTGVTA